MSSEGIYPGLPAGTVTFLFTDIEGSTRLLKQLGEAYATLLADQRTIMRLAFDKFAGREVDTQGDAFFVSFPRATQAVVAATEIQRALAKHTWPSGVAVRVRMGLHTGEPWLVEEGYLGMDVHRAARIAHIGHGGQVLLSETTAPLVQDELPEFVELLDLGYHRLKDLRRPEHIHQLVINELPSEFPPLNSLEIVSTPGRPEVETTARPPREVGTSPYQGLAAFHEDNAAFFFGREAFTSQLLDTIHQRHLAAVIVGSSGSGKSSAVFAGLLPILRRDGDWLIVSFRPGSHPFHALASALLPLLEPELDETGRLLISQKLADGLRSGEVTLLHTITRLLQKHPVANRLLLVADQFEELYTLCPDPTLRDSFLDELLTTMASGASHRPDPFALLLTLRADFMGQALTHRPFADALQGGSLMLGPMTHNELRSAIEKPAELQGAAFEAGLVERILDDVGEEPGNLPLLEFALTQLWEQVEKGWMTHAVYEQIGRVEGSLARYADQFYAGLDPAEQKEARRIFVQLVQPGQGTEDTRRVAKRADLVGVDWSLVQHLADKRLVVTSLNEENTETVEVVHEALIRGWGQLRAWMAADRAFRNWQETLRGALRGWESSGRDEGALLRGAPLAQAEEWLEQRSDEIGTTEQEYIQISLLFQQEQVAQRERRRRLIIGGLATGLVIALVLTIFAFTQRSAAVQNASLANQNAATAQAERARAEGEANARATQQVVAENARILADQRGDAALHAQATAEAERMRALDETRIATSRELALAAVSNLDVDPDRGILLALHALSTADTREAREALHQAVQNSRLVFAVPRKSYAVAYSPDGKRLVIGEEGGMLVFYSNTGEELLRFSGFAEVNWPITFSPDGKRLAAGDDDKLVKVWDAVTGEELFTLSGHTSYVEDIAFSPDGTRIATASSDKTAKLWDALNGQDLYTITDHADRVSGVSFSPDGKRLITASHDNTVKVRDAETGQVLLTPQGDAGYMGVYSPDGTRFFTSSSDNVTYKMWDAATGKELFAISLGDIASFVFSTDGKRLVFGGQNGDLTVWDSLTGEKLLTVTTPIFIDVWTLSPDGIHAATVNEDWMTRVWDLSPKGSRELFTLVPHGGDWVRRVRYSPDGTRLATAGMDGTAKVFDATTGNEILTLSGHTDSIFGLAYSPDGTRLATASYDRSVNVWDAATGELLLTLSKPGHGDGKYGRIYPGILDVAFSPDGTRLASAGADGTAVVWDALTGQEVLTLPSSNGLAIVDLAFNPEGTHLITTSDGNSVLKIFPTAKMWNLATGQLVFATPDQNPFLMGLTVNNDGSRFLTGAGDGVLRVWDSKTGKELLALPGHTGTIGDITFSANGKYIATASADGTAILWDAGTGKEFLTLTGHTGWVSGVSFSPDGTRLATSSQDGTVRVYSLQIEDLIALAHSHLTRYFTQAECQKYLHVETCPAEGD